MTSSFSGQYLRPVPQVRAAVESSAPVVARESMVIAHGLPRPCNDEVALAMEATIREEGAVPATIALLEG